MTGIWLCDIFTNGKRTILFDEINKDLTLHTEVRENGRMENNLVQDNWNNIDNDTTVRQI